MFFFWIILAFLGGCSAGQESLGQAALDDIDSTSDRCGYYQVTLSAHTLETNHDYRYDRHQFLASLSYVDRQYGLDLVKDYVAFYDNDELAVGLPVEVLFMAQGAKGAVEGSERVIVNLSNTATKGLCLSSNKLSAWGDQMRKTSAEAPIEIKNVELESNLCFRHNEHSEESGLFQGNRRDEIAFTLGINEGFVQDMSIARDEYRWPTDEQIDKASFALKRTSMGARDQVTRVGDNQAAGNQFRTLSARRFTANDSGTQVWTYASLIGSGIENNTIVWKGEGCSEFSKPEYALSMFALDMVYFFPALVMAHPFLSQR